MTSHAFNGRLVLVAQVIVLGAVGCEAAAIPAKLALSAVAALVFLLGWLLIGSQHRGFVVLTALMILALFTPPLVGGGQSGAPFRAEDALVLAAGAALLLGGRRPRLGEVEMGLALLFCAAGVAMIVSSAQAQFPTSWADFFFFPRLVRYALFALVARECARETARSSVQLATAGVLGLFALVGLAQYLGYAEATRFFYNPSANDRAALLLQGASWRRAIGPIGNANYFGFLSAIGVALAAAALLAGSNGFRARLLAAMSGLACLSGVVVSGSRTALVACLAMALVLVLAGSANGQVRRNVLLLSAAAAAGSWTVLKALRGQPVMARFDALLHGSSQVVSFGERRAVWADALSSVQGHSVFGIGPGKGVLAQWVDNDYIRMFRDFGAVGAGCYAALLLAALWYFLRRGTMLVGPGRAESAIAAALITGLLVMGAASDVFYETQVMGVIFALLGVLSCRSTRGAPV